MTLPLLRDDSLISTSDGSALRVSLPWIRSLPLTSLQHPGVTIDDVPVEDVAVLLDGRRVAPGDLSEDHGWWFQQDRVTLAVPHELAPGIHEVVVEFGLRIPYLQVGPDGPLTLPFRAEKSLVLDAPHLPVTVVRAAAPVRSDGSLPAGWVLSASAFNWTPEMIAGDRDAADIAVGIVQDGVAQEIEAEPGQLWRSFPGRANTRPRRSVNACATQAAASASWAEHRRLVAAGHAPVGGRAVRVPPAADRDRAPARRAGPAPADRTGGPTHAESGYCRSCTRPA